MIYIETEKNIGKTFLDELNAYGIPATKYSVGTRRIVDGVLKKGFNRSVGVDVDAIYLNDIQHVIDSHDTTPEYQIRAIQKVKDESNRRIYARVPATKQSNYLARTSELKLIVDGIKNPSYDPEDPLTTEWLEGWEPRSWTPQELGEFNFINGEWQWVLTVRAASNAIEQQILGMTGNEILEFDISASAEWPE